MKDLKIPFSDLGALHKEISAELNSAISRAVRRGDFILGEDVRLLEEEFSGFCGSRYAVGVSSGTAALFLALKSLGIGPGDEVIVPAFTYIATAFAVSYNGAKPVFVDIEEDTYNIDPQKIRQAVTKNTKAVIPVHLFGQAANMAEISKIARESGLKVVEDAAQAHGSEVKIGAISKKAGSVGEAGCFSFYPSKNLGGMGDGGMVVTDDEAIYKKIRLLRNCGRVSKYDHAEIGYNSRLDTLQAAILRVKLKRLNRWNALRRKVAVCYNDLFKGLPGVITPACAPFAGHVYHVYAVRTKRRDEAVAAFRDRGIDVIVHYPEPLHLQGAYSGAGYRRGDFPVAEQISREIVSLPIFPQMKKAQIKAVVQTLSLLLKR